MKTVSSKINSRPIGVFDSGLGGLTVLKELEQYLPNESFIYFGDTARVPYGNKSSDNVINYSQRIIQFLINKNIKLAVVACNTSSALALSHLNNLFDMPIFGVISPSVKFAEKISKFNQIGVIGTNATIKSKAYSKAFKKMGSNKKITEYACPLFVPLIEEGMLRGQIVKKIILHYLKKIPLNKIDTLILGCTHYPLISTELQKYVGNNITLISSGKVLAKDIGKYLYQTNMNSKNKTLKTNFYVTDFPQKFQKLTSLFLCREVKNILLTDLP